MTEFVRVAIVLVFIEIYLLWHGDCGTVRGSDPYIGVVGKSLILNWTYSSTKSPTEVTILVGQLNKTDLLKIWTIQLSSDKPLWEKTEIDSGLPEAVFNNNTLMKSEGRTKFSLTIKSVPANVKIFRFVCKVAEDIWSVAAQGQSTVKLASQPVIEYKVRYLNGNNSVGGIIEMVCAATGSPPPIVTVKRQLSSETVILKNATQRVVYSIANPQPSDNGKYVCIAKNIAGDVEKDVLVEVKYPPVMNFTFVANSIGDHVKMGTDVNMYCSAKGFPTPKMTLSTREGSKLLEIESSSNAISYTISNIQPKDTKRYVCSAANVAGTSTKEKQIIVEYIKPGSTGQQNLIVKKGDMLDLNCDVMGVPSPAFTWFKDGKKLTTASKTLQIRFDSDESFGKYTCEASNNAGKHAVLFVIKEIYINKNNIKTNHILKLGEKRTLDCSIEGHPTIRHTWYKGKKKLSESKTLVIHLDKKDKFGNYTCIGKNDAGDEIMLFSLKEKPKKEERGVNGSWKTTGSTSTLILPLTSLLLLMLCQNR